jgi:alcohol dehydrogenase, propanol-preferring
MRSRYLCYAASELSYALASGEDDIPISLFLTIIRGLKIVGSSVGTEKEMGELLEMAAGGEFKAIVKVFEFK